jgi:hypothetical protein
LPFRAKKQDVQEGGKNAASATGKRKDTGNVSDNAYHTPL